MGKVRLFSSFIQLLKIMNNLSKNAFIGIVFIIIGAVWALDNVELIPWQVSYYLFQWENILIGVGAMLLITQENVKVGGILLALGLFFVLDDWFRVDIHFWDLWPLVLVFVGVYLLNRKNTNSDHTYDSDGDSHDRLDDTAIFSGGDKVFNTQNFKGGNLTAVFGGSNIDLTTCNTSQQVVVIDVFYMFGGSKIRVPQHWNVDVKATNIFGGISDKRQFVNQTVTDAPCLVIKGLVLFGGAEIMN